MLYTEKNVLTALKNGKIHLKKGDILTPAARDLIAQLDVAKPENMTHLNAKELVEKTHPRIAFRGKIDSLEAEILLCQKEAGAPVAALQEMLDFVRKLIRADVLGETVGPFQLCGMDEAQLRERSHNPQKYYGIGHVPPTCADSMVHLRLNHLRTSVRETELQSYHAFPDRTDIHTALNRLSSLCWILCLQEKTK